MKQPLLNRDEIIELTSLDHSVKEHDLKPHMNFEGIFNKWLDLDLYKVFDAGRKEYTATEYDMDFVYSVGDYAVEDELVYELVHLDGNGSNELICNDFWKEAPRYEPGCVADIYPYLKDWLAWQIATDVSPFIHVEVSRDGMMTTSSNRRGNKGAEETMINLSLGSYKSKSRMALGLFNAKLELAISSESCTAFDKAVDLCSGKGLSSDNSVHVTYGVAY